MFKIEFGQLGWVSDVSTKESGPKIEAIYQIDLDKTIYDMHPVISFKNNADSFVYHKKVLYIITYNGYNFVFKIDPRQSKVSLNETDGVIGGDDIQVWLSMCCDEDLDSCHAHTQK